MRKNFFFWALTALVLLFTAFIFSNSFKNAQASHNDSAVITQIVEPVLENVFQVPPQNTEHVVRKSAHFIEFAALGVSIVGWTLFVNAQYKKSLYGFSCFYALLVAVLDEFIQTFSDRGASVTDVLLDFSGALFGGVCLFLLVTIIKLLSNKNQKLPNENTP